LFKVENKKIMPNSEKSKLDEVLGSGLPDLLPFFSPEKKATHWGIPSPHAEPMGSAHTLGDFLSDEYLLLQQSRDGVSPHSFYLIMAEGPLSLQEWLELMYISEEEMLKYHRARKPLGPLQSARILEIARLLRKGESVFEDRERFKNWLNAKVPALGSVTPKSLLDSTFGVAIVHDELTRIEHGVLA
jgi:putative toxin-antitoxin system antitoxin component (TIGR02293 family)